MSLLNKEQIESATDLDVARDTLLDAKLAMLIAYAKAVRGGLDEDRLDEAITLLSGPSTFDQEEEAKAA